MTQEERDRAFAQVLVDMEALAKRDGGMYAQMAKRDYELLRDCIPVPKDEWEALKAQAMEAERNAALAYRQGHSDGWQECHENERGEP